MNSTASSGLPVTQFWICVICGWIYDESAGLPEDGIPPGTTWAEVPGDWVCPLCQVGKDKFVMVPL